MRLLKTLGVLAAICAALVIILVLAGGWEAYSPGPFPATPGYENSHRLGSEIGRWLGILLISAAFASVAAWFSRKKHTINYPGLKIGIFIALLLTLANWIGSPAGQRLLVGEESIPRSARYAPNHCNYQVSFPGQPIIKKLKLFHGRWFEIERADYADATGYYRAECFPFEMTAEIAEVMVQGHALNEKLQRIVITAVTLGVIQMSGYKTTDGKDVRMVARVHYGAPTCGSHDRWP